MINAMKPEVLSPVGNVRMLEAAVRSGADAVYLGAKDFSARRNAENFDLQELQESVKYCHIRGVKVYLTLNIMVKDQEIADAFTLAKNAYNIGIDGIIIEDLGLAKLLHTHIPDLPLHASTQMTVHSPSALNILKDLGFCRVVAGREMSYKELTDLCNEAKKLDIEVEVFVHGALCMSLSGQCLLSAFLGSRSGNRGLCAGPCRLPFSVDNGTGYDLSLKDLSLLKYIDKLTHIGVASLKIEGRMKRPEYVAAATAACRQAVDTGVVEEELDNMLRGVFSRAGFTTGYFEGKIDKNMFGIRTKEDVISANDAFPKIHEIYRGEHRSVYIIPEIIVKANEPVCLTLTDGINTVRVYGDIPQAAKSKSATAESITDGINKFGSTPYLPKEIKATVEEGLFVPASALNDLRRKAVFELDKKRGQVVRPTSNAEIPPRITTNTKANPKTIIRVEDFNQIPTELSGISAIIFPLEKDFGEIKANIPLIAEIPRGIISESVILNKLLSFKEKGFTSALCGNLAAVNLAKKAGLTPLADTGLNIHNSYSATVLEGLGAKAIVLSNEILLSDAATLNSPVPKGIIAYGKIPLMLYRNCPLKNGRDCSKCEGKGIITDRLGTSFTVRCRMGYSEMLNSVPIWLADKKKELSNVDFNVLYFTFETPEEVADIIKAYKNGLSAKGDYTRGLFFRGSL